jgi:hypothetical protein
MSDDQARIVRFWHAVEAFSPRQLPGTDTRNHISDFRPGDPLPWEPGANLPQPEPGNVWHHEIFAGVYDLSKVRDVLVARYGEDAPEPEPEPEPEPAPVPGQSALFACTVDADGYLVEESAALSACAWAIGQVIRGKPTLTGFRSCALDHAEELRKLTGAGKILAESIRGAGSDAADSDVTAHLSARTGSGPRPTPRIDLAPLTGSALHRLTAELADRIGVTDHLQPRNIRVYSYEISASRAGNLTNRPSFLNSHVADDLALVAAMLNDGDAGAALTQYLSATPSTTRIDVRKEPLAVRQGCVPDEIPAGRWVTDIARPLTFSQQFAANQILRTLNGTSGLFAVNAPPGTGKTTMLRDVIAAIVVNRAIEIARLPSPGAAFAGESKSWQTAEYRHTITPPDPELTGFEIVVASLDNGAAQNVIAEISGPKGIDDQWRNAAAAVDYFSDTGTWAMIAARPGDARVLDMPRQPPDWPGAVASFERALSRVKALMVERSVVSHSITRLSVTERDLAEAERAAESATAQREKLEDRWPHTDQRLRLAEERCEAADAAVVAHRADKPGPFASLSAQSRAARRTWDAEHAGMRRRLTEAAVDRNEALRAAQILANQIADARRAEDAARNTRDRVTGELGELRRQIAHGRQRWGDHVPDGSEYAETEELAAIERREKSAPWADAEFTVARTELFLAALALHKALILAEAPRFRQNLAALMDIVDGRERPTDAAAALAAWRTLFLVVPVVSATFASVDRLFAGLGRESLGWLLADEAGQAPPQHAVGALWRSRRAVIVGDPLQLKPMVTVPWEAQRALLREFDVGEQWAPGRTSVQQVCDRLAEHGTALPSADGEEPVWVGTPLRVHRRCDRPMFDISNQIAYDGLMVFGTPERPRFHGRGDIWCDIRSATSIGHWIPAEGEMLRTMLSRLRDAGVSAAQIRVISPFRMVAGHAKEVHQSVFPEVSGRDRDNWVGTVHTMRDKEADAVILILGGDPDRPGARRFATGEPNLLNVAVSRARRRLYVIGNRDIWGAEPFFEVLAACIPAWRA